MDLKKCNELIILCNNIQSQLIKLQKKIDENKQSKMSLGALIGAVIGGIIAVGVTIALPFLLPIGIALAIGISATTASLGGIGVALYKRYKEGQTVKILENMIDVLEHIKSNTKNIKFLYDEIKQAYLILHDDKPLKELSEADVEEMIYKIEQERPKIVLL